MKNRARIAALVLLLIGIKTSHGADMQVTKFGAVADGKTLITKAIQAAIDSCAATGGGVVVFPAGTYLSGTIYLKSHVHLYLSPGAVLLGSTNIKEYPLNQSRFVSYSDKYVARALVWAEDLTDIGISGPGSIDGQGAKFLGARPKLEAWREDTARFDSTRYVPQLDYINRPYLIRFISCRNVKIKDVTLKNSAMWMQQYLNCDLVTIENITVYNHGNKNNDMIDIDCCRHVVIHGCFGDSDDDGITLKSTAPVPTEDVSISDCTVSSFCNAIKMGTESLGGFKNITISNCIIRPSSEPNQIYGRRQGLAGIALEIVDGGVMENITISNISIKGTTAPIFIRLGDRGRVPRPNADRPLPGKMKNIKINNIIASHASPLGCAISGVPQAHIQNLALSHIDITFEGGVDSTISLEQILEKEGAYPECMMFGMLPARGFYIRHVDKLSLDNISITAIEPDVRPAIVCDDVSDFYINHLDSRPGDTSLLSLRKARDGFITGCKIRSPKQSIVMDEQCSGIKCANNYVSGG